MASIEANKPPAAYVSNVFDAEFLQTFKGPTAGCLFVDRSGNEGRYIFALFFDFFWTKGMKINGASTSCGILSAVCSNLPLDICYKLENMYIAGVVPGPAEPYTTELNHYLHPIINDLLVSWERGVHYSHTANHPAERDMWSAIALGLGNLPAARQLSAQAGHSSHNYCTRCKCFHQDMLCRVNIHHSNWIPKDPLTQRQKAEDWKIPQPALARRNYSQCMVCSGQSSGVFLIGIWLKCSLLIPCVFWKVLCIIIFAIYLHWQQHPPMKKYQTFMPLVLIYPCQIMCINS